MSNKRASESRNQVREKVESISDAQTGYGIPCLTVPTAISGESPSPSASISGSSFVLEPEYENDLMELANGDVCRKEKLQWMMKRLETYIMVACDKALDATSGSENEAFVFLRRQIMNIHYSDKSIRRAAEEDSAEVEEANMRIERDLQEMLQSQRIADTSVGEGSAGAEWVEQSQPKPTVQDWEAGLKDDEAKTNGKQKKIGTGSGIVAMAWKDGKSPFA